MNALALLKAYCETVGLPGEIDASMGATLELRFDTQGSPGLRVERGCIDGVSVRETNWSDRPECVLSFTQLLPMRDNCSPDRDLEFCRDRRQPYARFQHVGADTLFGPEGFADACTFVAPPEPGWCRKMLLQAGLPERFGDIFGRRLATKGIGARSAQYGGLQFCAEITSIEVGANPHHHAYGCVSLGFHDPQRPSSFQSVLFSPRERRWTMRVPDNEGYAPEDVEAQISLL